MIAPDPELGTELEVSTAFHSRFFARMANTSPNLGHQSEKVRLC